MHQISSNQTNSLKALAMGFPFPSKSLCPLMVISIVLASPMFLSAANLFDYFDIIWGDSRAKILNNGDILQLSLDQCSGSGVRSKREYLFGKFDMQIKLAPGNSVGTVTTFYLQSQGDAYDAIDIEFLGNLSGDPYTLHTNLHVQGKGEWEQQFRLWFDPTANFHTYTILWNPKTIVWYVDGTPIREFRNLEYLGIPYPKSQRMSLYSTIWKAEGWATTGGTVRTNSSQAPLTALYTNFNVDESQWLDLELDETSRRKMVEIQNNYMIYNYCTDVNRFPQGLPPECNANLA